MTKQNSRTILVISSIIIPVLWVTNLLLVPYLMPDNTEHGTFGDMFGTSTSFFSAVSVFLLIYTVILQREEIAAGKEEFKRQNRTLSYQRFDNTFFNMIDLHNKIVESIPGPRFMNLPNSYFLSLSAKQSLADLKGTYHSMGIEKQIEQRFGQYLRHFDLCVEFILSRKKLPANQDFYLKIYFAQLSKEEKEFLLYHLNLNSTPRKYFQRVKLLLFDELTVQDMKIPQHSNLLDGVSPVK